MVFSCRFNCLISSYRLILYIDYYSFKELIVFSLEVTILLWVHGFIMMSSLFKGILKSCTTDNLLTYFLRKKLKVRASFENVYGIVSNHD